jgi:hypothetical protein
MKYWQQVAIHRWTGYNHGRGAGGMGCAEGCGAGDEQRETWWWEAAPTHQRLDRRPGEGGGERYRDNRPTHEVLSAQAAADRPTAALCHGPHLQSGQLNRQARETLRQQTYVIVLVPFAAHCHGHADRGEEGPWTQRSTHRSQMRWGVAVASVGWCRGQAAWRCVAAGRLVQGAGVLFRRQGRACLVVLSVRGGQRAARGIVCAASVEGSGDKDRRTKGSCHNPDGMRVPRAERRRLTKRAAVRQGGGRWSELKGGRAIRACEVQRQWRIGVAMVQWRCSGGAAAVQLESLQADGRLRGLQLRTGCAALSPCTLDPLQPFMAAMRG